jgi:hypothetical protein
MNIYSMVRHRVAKGIIKVHREGCPHVRLAVREGWGVAKDIEAESDDEAIEAQQREFVKNGRGMYEFQKELCIKEKAHIKITHTT